MSFGLMYISLRRAQVRMPHQFRHAKHFDAGLDGPRSVGMTKIVEAEWRLDSALPQRPLLSWVESRRRRGTSDSWLYSLFANSE